MACTISAGIGIVCADLRRTGGVNKKVWVGNITDLRAPFNIDTTDYIQNIELNTYRTLYAFEGAKFSHSGASNLAKTDSGNVSFSHEFLLKVFNTNPTDDFILESLATSDVFVICQTMNDDFLIYGGANGLSASALTAQTGKNQGDDSTTTVTLSGSERTLPKRFLVGGDKQLTLNRLNAMTA